MVLPGGFTVGANRSGFAMAVNDQGWIVGTEGPVAGSTASSSGVLWKDGEYKLATSLLPDSYSGLMRIHLLRAINNRGQLAAQASVDIDGDPATIGWKGVAVRLDPIRSPGDTNYDNAVNFTDLLALAQHYGQSGNGNVFWETGDFNFDWAVNFDDLLTLSQHYSAAGQFEADWQLARSLVPEPACVSILSLAICLRGRRRHR